MVNWESMSGFFAFVGANLGGWIGWVLGARVGFMSAYVLSVVGMAAGVYAGRRAAAALLD